MAGQSLRQEGKKNMACQTENVVLVAPGRIPPYRSGCARHSRALSSLSVPPPNVHDRQANDQEDEQLLNRVAVLGETHLAWERRRPSIKRRRAAARRAASAAGGADEE